MRVTAGLKGAALPDSWPWTAARIAAQTKHHNAMQLVTKQAEALSPGRSGSECFVCRQFIGRACTCVCIHAILLNALKQASWTELITHSESVVASLDYTDVTSQVFCTFERNCQLHDLYAQCSGELFTEL